MSHDQLGIEGLPQDFVREVLTMAFDKLVHDFTCSCESADPVRASAALLSADWTIKDAFEAWHVAWLDGRFDA